MPRQTIVLLCVALMACTSVGDDGPTDGLLPPEDLSALDALTPPDAPGPEARTPETALPPDGDPGVDAPDACGDTAGIGVLRFGIDGDGDGASAGAGEDVPFLLEWALSAAPDCPGCPHAVVLGVGGAAARCWQVDGPPPCPEIGAGIGAGLLVAPGTAGVHVIDVAAIPGVTCDAAGPAFDTAPRETVGTLTVTGTCPDPACADAAFSCGTWENGCGGACATAPCAEGAVCTGDGACVPGEGCGPGVFALADVFLNGKAGTTDAAPGAAVALSLSWTAGNGPACPGCERQLVFGVDGAPIGCEDLGVPGTCPAMDAGTWAVLFDAPDTPGTFSILAQSYAAYDCADAEARFVLGGPKRPAGTLHVGTPCAPATCAELGRACGRVADACGGLTDCGACADSQRCTPAGQCKPLASCDGDLFEIQDLVLDGGGPVLGVASGPVVALLRWRAGVTGDKPAQVVVGLGAEAAFCRDLGTLPPCGVPATGAVAGFLTPPGAPATHAVRAALLRKTDCAAALAAFDDGATGGLLRVGEDCAPATCDGLDVQCGVWGDGCGHAMGCGGCPDGQTCGPAGRCGTSCSQGVLAAADVAINQSGPVGSAAPGQSIPVTLHWTLGNPDDCEGCPRPLLVGVGDTPGPCTVETPATCPGTSVGVLNVVVDAPAAPGDHTVYLHAPLDEPGCGGAALMYPSDPTRLPIGVLHVTGGCAPETCLTLGAACGVVDDGCGFSLDCGACPGGELCFDGTCACFAHDDYEPNDVPAQAHDLGTYPDADTASSVDLTAMVDDETDWFLMGATDEMWAYVNPTAHVEPGADLPYTVQAVFLCSDGTAAETLVTATETCAWAALDFTGVPGVTGPVSGWRCDGVTGPMDIELSPDCPTADDSGRFLLGVGTTAGCTAYDLALHL